jgi:putative ubiquitin-RnfH superfamily antitoxin RatB of RatAB toxin-antitoxin module
MPEVRISVEVAYARADRQLIVPLQVVPGTTVEQAVLDSGILREFPDINFRLCKMGIFGKTTPRDTPVKLGDRVEIYRPLLADPKEIRRQRAAEAKNRKKGTSVD